MKPDTLTQTFSELLPMANKNMRSIGIALVVLILLFLVFRMLSGYGDISTDQGAGITELFKSKERASCVPGPGKDAAYYTGEGSGGFCGDQKAVHYHGHEYMITGGIGGPLLART